MFVVHTLCIIYIIKFVFYNTVNKNKSEHRTKVYMFPIFMLINSCIKSNISNMFFFLIEVLI